MDTGLGDGDHSSFWHISRRQPGLRTSKGVENLLQCLALLAAISFGDLFVLVIAKDFPVRRDLARIAVAGADNRDIIEAVDRDALVVRDRNRQRPDILTIVVYVVYTSSLLSDFCPAQEHDHSRSNSGQP